jgi:hypothetical protein
MWYLEVILLDMSHMLRRGHIQEEQGKVRNPKLESVWCAHCKGANTATLKQEVNMGRWPESSEEVW